MKIILVLSAILFIVLVLWFYRANKVKIVYKSMSYGPFTIKSTASTRKVFNLNYGMAKQTSIGFSIWYQDHPIAFPGRLESNTGLPWLWKVYALNDGSEPTLLAGSQNAYLIKLVNNKLIVESLYSQSHDFATLQYLDSDHNQPGKEFTVYSTSSPEDMTKLDTLSGGRYLLICKSLVLDTKTNQKYPIHNDGMAVDNYSYATYHSALTFSPDRQSIVFAGAFQTWNTNDTDYIDHALVVLNFVTNKHYTVPFDDTETRLRKLDDLDRAWIESRFEWIPDHHNYFTLHLKKHDKPYNWLGEYTERDHYYYLYPVKPVMLDVFLEFVLKNLGWTKANIIQDHYHEYTGRVFNLSDGKIKLDIRYKPDESRISLSKDLYSSENEELPSIEKVKELAMTFNAELSSGKWQEYFTNVIKERY